jgi:hypothetical protein
MQLLFVNRDRASARKMHGEFLDYRGVDWNLEHCDDPAKVARLLENQPFQALLYRTEATLERSLDEMQLLLQGAGCPSIVTVAKGYNEPDHLCMINAGSDDCLDEDLCDGSGLMRALRMAELRNSIDRQTRPTLLDGPWSDLLLQSIKQEPGPDKLLESLLHPQRRWRVGFLSATSALVDRTRGDWKDMEMLRFHSVDELFEQLENDRQIFDALLVDQSSLESANDKQLDKLRTFLPIVPSLVLTLEHSDLAALNYLKMGFRECLIDGRETALWLPLALQKTILRHRRFVHQAIELETAGPNVNDRRGQSRGDQNRRRHARFFLQRPVLAIPVLPNGGPDVAGRSMATSIDISLGGIGIQMADRDQLPSRHWIIGIPYADRPTGYVSAYLRRVAYTPEGLQLGLVFQTAHDDFFRDQNMVPKAQGESMRLATAIDTAHLEQWANVGVLQRRLVHRARVCPECQGLATFGTGCSQCGSFHLDYADLIHHFACAHVGLATEFQKQSCIQCPKCLARDLVVGADFEWIRSQFTCMSCQYQGEETADVGCCMRCDLRFPESMAREVEVYGYDVERLDILALVNDAR